MKPVTPSMAVLLTIAILSCTFTTICDGKVSDELKVRLSHGGGVTGKYITSNKGHGILAFYGIPFAEPPVGPLRFANPKPKVPWTGYIESTMDNKVCPQLGAVASNEDCLYLNVFTPSNPRRKGPLPVMVFIHGGGFVGGSGGAPFVAPDYLLDHDVVFVSGNYRVGALGFLSVGTEASPGNFGLKDQVLLLKWVQENVAAFNGNSNEVTLFGGSAGAASVSLHLVSPLAKGLFHRAILHSGTSYAPWALDYKDKKLEVAQQFGHELDCELGDEGSQDKFIDCLRQKRAEDILTVTAKITDPNSLAVTLFMPVIEPTGSDAFLTKKAHEYVSSHGLKVPLINGFTAQEGTMSSGALYANEETMTRWRNNVDGFVSRMTGIPETDKKSIDQIKSFYFKEGQFSKENIRNITDMSSDAWFLAPADELLMNRLVANRDSADTFVYLFNHKGSATSIDMIAAFMGYSLGDTYLGVGHGDDMFSIFPTAEAIMSHIVPTKEDRFIQETMTEMWVNFASTGNPNGDSTIAFKWASATDYPIDYLRVGTYEQPRKPIFGMEQGLLEERMSFWRQIRK